jgi:hypothetical protein
MVKEICLIVSLAGILFNPLIAVCADFTVFDQFTDAYDAGLFQGVQVGSELNLESYSDSSSTQGINVITNSSYSGKAVQVASIEYDLSLITSEGDNVVQGVNIFRGSADAISQMAIINGVVTLTSRNTSGGIQGINVITSCDSCN